MSYETVKYKVSQQYMLFDFELTFVCAITKLICDGAAHGKRWSICNSSAGMVDTYWATMEILTASDRLSNKVTCNPNTVRSKHSTHHISKKHETRCKNGLGDWPSGIMCQCLWLHDLCPELICHLTHNS